MIKTKTTGTGVYISLPDVQLKVLIDYIFQFLTKIPIL